MKRKLKIAVVKRLLQKGLVPEAEVACMELGLSLSIINRLQGGK